MLCTNQKGLLNRVVRGGALLASVAVLSLASACAVSATDDGSEDAFDLSESGSAVDKSEDGDFRQIQQNFAVSSCASADANKTFTADIDPGHTSPRSYNTCTKGYVVDLNDIHEDYVRYGIGGGGRAKIHISTADSGNKAACESTDLRVVVYTKKIGVDNWSTASGVVDTGTKSGVWYSDSGANPNTGDIVLQDYCSLSYSFVGMTAGADYRFAITSRSSGNTRKVNIWTQPATDIR